MGQQETSDHWDTLNRVGIGIGLVIGFASTFLLVHRLDEDLQLKVLVILYGLLVASLGTGFLLWRNELISRIAGWCAAALLAGCFACLLPFHPSYLPLIIAGALLLGLELMVGSLYLSWRVRMAQEETSGHDTPR
jgi:hypothetical protein